MPSLFRSQRILTDTLLCRTFRRHRIKHTTEQRLPLIRGHSLDPEYLLQLVSIIFLHQTYRQIAFRIRF